LPVLQNPGPREEGQGEDRSDLSEGSVQKRGGREKKTEEMSPGPDDRC